MELSEAHEDLDLKERLMRRIAIIGGGQAGTLLAHGLLRAGFEVTLIEAQSPDEMRRAKVRSTAVIHNDSANIERDLGLGFWADVERPIGHSRIQFRDLENNVIASVFSNLKAPYIGIDQRTKFPRFMEEFERRGGRLLVQSVTVNELEVIADEHDLVVVCAGKGEIGKLFATDPVRTIFTSPPRNNAALLVRDFKEWDHIAPNLLKFEFFRSVGDWFSMPFWAEGVGACRAVVLQAVAGGPMDIMNDATTGQQVLDRFKQMIAEFTTEDYAHFENAQLTDENAWLVGQFVPTIRNPVGTLPSGRKIMAIADTAMTHEPICGCGANSAARQAAAATQAIIERGAAPYDELWMARVAMHEYSTFAKHSMDFVRTITGDMNPVAWRFLQAAHHSPSIGHEFANMYVTFEKTALWMRDQKELDSLLSAYASELEHVDFIPFEVAFPEFAGQTIAA
jgi:2-polyprenyl-6-methoxyphenol hydroxylase-like FAD-dependent oxidoreductase